jgi:hypothetical protein
MQHFDDELTPQEAMLVIGSLLSVLAVFSAGVMW